MHFTDHLIFEMNYLFQIVKCVRLTCTVLLRNCTKPVYIQVILNYTRSYPPPLWQIYSSLISCSIRLVTLARRYRSVFMNVRSGVYFPPPKKKNFLPPSPPSENIKFFLQKKLNDFIGKQLLFEKCFKKMKNLHFDVQFFIPPWFIKNHILKNILCRIC